MPSKELERHLGILIPRPLRRFMRLPLLLLCHKLIHASLHSSPPLQAQAQEQQQAQGQANAHAQKIAVGKKCRHPSTATSRRLLTPAGWSRMSSWLSTAQMCLQWCLLNR